MGSPRIYTYKITFEEVPYYYYGVHKEKYLNEYYMGYPITHKRMWDFYTPKKQILQLFDYTDEGWIEAQEVEKRLIKPFYNTDNWCLNEHCGGYISLDILRKVGKQNKELKRGYFSLSPQKQKINQRINGRKAVLRNKEKGNLFWNIEWQREQGLKGGNKIKELGVGLFGITAEEKTKNAKLGGKTTSSQKWECLETGFITNAGCLSRYQKARGIDTSKRKRIS